ncbi:MAG: hypothetical protein A2233_00640 [Candidatus Kerfeldbacteria bacterium RIFOXYA2_FULL_38_24]|uniref:HIT domain-containing protein n=1 Tax=Candidatus Kerfeldbacteria bacterium RIFOXYB2_FULL_38_14 TaxID=1798547 RepID=A0A1G2BCA4_9BACT|nr:MAG: hypothetical protein A2233_00640 [Candidatus Kerfeldbacteria bacterium RIFOXYA2_FULL_38_24]OGY86665.1 MAG: hypothetical protein A2319_02930 [Candidatus Kerfeldbacteria bacterium RIFOXYB2_FULL_38_14]
MVSEVQCQYCYNAPAPKEQFYETKLFRVLVARRSFADGHIIIVPKKHDPHFYGFSLDELEEFGYLVKKTSFWAMRLTRAPGFTLLMNDGTPEVADQDHLEIHVLPRPIGSQQFKTIADAIESENKDLPDEEVEKIVQQLKNLMQLPQV